MSDVTTGTVLAVDDEPANLELLVRILAEHDPLRVETVSDPRQALQAFHAVAPDLVLLDVNMPHLNGFEVMSQLQAAIPEDRFVPIVVMTANVDPGTRREALAMGAHDFVDKPFDAAEIRLRVHNFLRMRQLYVQLEQQKELLEERVAERTRDLERANHELLLADRVKTDFLALVSHEMRTPLTVIKGFGELLMRRWDQLPPEQRERHGEAIERNMSRLEDMIGNLLLAAELEVSGGSRTAAGRPATASEVSLERLLAQVVHDSRLDAGAVTVRCTPGAVAVVDLGVVQPVLSRLLDNAHKYGAPPVEVTCALVDGAVTFEVRDHGDGVPGDFRDLLFERFTQASVGDQRTATGSGLGLWIAQRLALSCGGELTHEPAAPGARFRLRLPLVGCRRP